MADENSPLGITTDGTTRVVFLPSLTDPAHPTAAELNGGTAVDITCLLTSDGWNLSVDESAIADTRLCDRADYERRGRTKWSLETTYVRARETDEDLAYSTLKPGTTGYMVERIGPDYEDNFATTDKVRVIPIEAGEQRPVPVAPNENQKVIQKQFVTARVYSDVSVAAGA